MAKRPPPAKRRSRKRAEPLRRALFSTGILRRCSSASGTRAGDTTTQTPPSTRKFRRTAVVWTTGCSEGLLWEINHLVRHFPRRRLLSWLHVYFGGDDSEAVS